MTGVSDSDARAPAAVQAATDTSSSDVAIETAAVVLTLAMQDTEWPASDLGGALERISRILRTWRDRSGNPLAVADADKAIASELAICLQSLQFHDRLMQQLAAVRSLLASLVSDAPPAGSEHGAKRWQELLQQIRNRLTADSQHKLFQMLMRNGTIDGAIVGAGHAAEGGVELF